MQRRPNAVATFTTGCYAGMLQDRRYGFRTLLKSPGYSVVATLVLALGIGANTAVFSLANWLLLRPVPGVERPNELVSVRLEMDGAGALFPITVTESREVAALPGLQALAGSAPRSPSGS